MEKERLALNEKFYDGKRQFEKEFEEEFKGKYLPGALEHDPAGRWACYCLTKKKIDIDVSEWAVKSYKEHYGFLQNSGYVRQQGCDYKYEMKKDDVIYRGDTMTSYGNFIRQYYCIMDNLGNIGKGKCAEKVLAGEQIEDYMAEFAYLCHTQGNLIPVPLCFNSERAGAFADCDQWDLTMYHIYKWCESGDDGFIVQLLNRYNGNDHMSESVYRFKLWMREFDCNWKKFVRDNFLRAFVELSSEEWYPIEFWRNHFAFNRKIGSLSREEFENAVKQINKCILGRNMEIEKFG